MAIATTNDPSGKPIVLGAYVRDNGYGRVGRVTDIDFSFGLTSQARNSSDGGEAWLAGQFIPVSDEQRRGRWISILVHGGGSILVPADRVEVVDPFPFVNDMAALYFGEDPEVEVTRSSDLTQLRLLGGELRVWEPGVHGDEGERDLGRMYVLEALGVSLLVRERQDGTYVHVENEGVVREPLLVEVNNGGENAYGEDSAPHPSEDGTVHELSTDPTSKGVRHG